MLIKQIAIFIYVAIFVPRSIVHGELTKIVQTDKGPVQGEIVKTVQDSSVEYSAFRGIPYAKPPVNELRFRPPVEPDAWSETLIATKEGASCPQINEDTGSYDGEESCLFLNVYTPKKSFDENENERLAVMVWIHGGGFEGGSSKSEIYGPDFVIIENVIIVGINYRLGALGFLSLDIEEVTGNQGLKDQVLALKWVQKNIEKFGGDPKKVTIFGESAGSVAVLLHHLSPASKGLFRAVIAMSGTPLNPWAFNSISAAVNQAFEFGKQLGLDNNNKTELLNKLRDVHPEQLIQAAVNQYNSRKKTKSKNEMSIAIFMPTYENPRIASDIFMSECPVKKYETGDYEKMPIMLGFTSLEMLIVAGNFDSFSSVSELSKNYLNSIELGNLSIVNDLNTVINSPYKNITYFSNDFLYTMTQILSDLHFNTGIDSTQKYLVKNSSAPVYYYRNSFDYEQSRHRQAGVDLDGCAHADDLAHIFWEPIKNQPLEPKSRIGVHRTRMARLWANFAKYLDPTPDGPADPLLNFTWTPSGPQGLHLEIGNEKMTMEPRLITDTIKAIQEAANAFNHAECSSGGSRKNIYSETIIFIIMIIVISILNN